MHKTEAPVTITLLALATTTLAATALAQVEVHSTGSPQRGRIEGGGVELPMSGPGYHWVTNRENPDARYGTRSLVAALQRAAAVVATQHPGSDLEIEDLSRPGGGRIRGHGSHTSGRDVDVAYYARSPEGARIDPTTSTWFLRSGLARGFRADAAPRLDTERTWLFLATLASDETITLRFVFAATGLQRLLLAEGERAGPPAAHATLARVFRTPHGRDVDPHADHFHVRIECPPGDVACRP